MLLVFLDDEPTGTDWRWWSGRNAPRFIITTAISARAGPEVKFAKWQRGSWRRSGIFGRIGTIGRLRLRARVAAPSEWRCSANAKRRQRTMTMLQIALWEPEIPPNTGNIARLCAAMNTPLHLVGRLGFRIDEKSLRRAGLDYWDSVDLHQHDSLAQLEERLKHAGARLLCMSARATMSYTKISFRAGDCLLFGAETRGLPPEVLERYTDACYTIPMVSAKFRSLNLATAAGIVLYEGLRQLHGW
jgi:tRNA (cytidine/uridine-2'-O-)-methyltransferase